MDRSEDETAQRTPFERVYRGLLRGLYEGRFVPGQRLAAPDLMREFGVGRGTIREALNRLASSGIIGMVPHRGAEVRRLSRGEVNDLLDIVELLMGLAARGAARAIGDAERRALLVARDARIRDACRSGDFHRFLPVREDYYRAIVQLSGNRELQRLFPTAQIHIMRIQLRPYNRAADSMDHADFGSLTGAILSGDPRLAEGAGRSHVQLTRDRVAELGNRAFAPPLPSPPPPEMLAPGSPMPT